MKTTRRDFISACSALAGAGMLAPNLQAQSTPEAPNPTVENPAENPEIGKPYCGWKEGEMDLHFILTGVGENMFHIYPDGTTLLLDSADRDGTKYDKNLPPMPDGSRLPTEWIMRYLTRVNPGGKAIDYMMLSHYHEDHAGSEKMGAGTTTGRGEDYVLSGLANIGEHFKFTKCFDRGFPTYDHPKHIESDGYTNFVRFSQYMHKAGKFRMEEFNVGQQDQIALVKNAAKFPTFHTRNICRNGIIWTGKEGECRDFFPENEKNFKGWMNENSLSLGFTIEYGPFRYFTGGDFSGAVWTKDDERINLDEFAGPVIGKLDVCKTNHHSYKDSMKPGFCNAVKAHIYVSNVWDLYHLQGNTMEYMTEAADDVLVCPTMIHPKNREIYPSEPWLKNLAPEAWTGGHVVVKVFDEGRQYKLYYLTVQDESMTVMNVYGPFKSGT